MNLKTILALVSMLALFGCAMWERVDKAQTDGPDKSYSVDLPLGWVRFMPQSDGIAVTRDGFDLNRIHIVRRDLAKAFPKLKKPATADMLPSELAELAIAEAKTGAAETVITVKDNAPALVDGKTAYRLHLQHRNERGLVFDTLAYGLATPKGYFTLTYSSPSLFYSARDLPAFEKVVGSFRLTSP